jgi:hypothetical protein
MIIDLFNKFIEYLLVKFYPDYYECKIIARVNSSGSLVEYCDDNSDID